MKEKLLELFARETGQAVTLDTRLEDLPVDSLEFLDLILVIERELGIAQELSVNYETVGDFVL